MTAKKRRKKTPGRPRHELPAWEPLTRSQLVQLLETPGVTVDRWRAEQGLPELEGGGFAVDQVARWLVQQWKAARSSSAPAEADREEGLQRLRRVRAEREELRLARERGELVDREDVIEFAGRAVQTVRQRMNALVRKMASRLYQAPTEAYIEQQLQDEVDSICAAFERGMTDGQHRDDDGAAAGTRTEDPAELEAAEETNGQ